MHHFEYKNGELFCEDLALKEVAGSYGTPCYVYSAATLTRHFRAFDEPFSEVPHLVCYSVKACSNIAVLKLLAGMGAGFDVVSGGELFRVIAAGGDPGKVVYSGVGKTEEEIRYALDTGILMFNVESESELAAIDRVCRSSGRTARIALRVNPEVDPGTHPYVATGLKESKFGIHPGLARDLYQKALDMERVEPVGLDCHIGSQLTQTSPFVDALARMIELTESIRELGVNLRCLDLGGGLGITYQDEEPPVPAEYAREILAMARDLGVTLILEPGRVIAGNAAVLLTRVLYLKQTPAKRFVIVDAAMNDCMRPALYGAFHDIKTVDQKSAPGPGGTADVVGPVCESADFIAKDRPMPEVQEGDLLAVMSAGAYCASMASNYNSRPRAPEVLVSGREAHLVRERESAGDLVEKERIPGFLS